MKGVNNKIFRCLVFVFLLHVRCMVSAVGSRGLGRGSMTGAVGACNYYYLLFLYGVLFSQYGLDCHIVQCDVF
jgi:hypothetical protein